MSSIPTKQIDGDVAVGRNVSAGGNANIQGSTRIGHDLVVEGWLYAKNIKGPNKGIFTDAQKLREAYPHPHDGWFACVGTSSPFAAYVGEGGLWVNTGGTIEVTVDISPEAVKDILDDVNNLKSNFQNHSYIISKHTKNITDLETADTDNRNLIIAPLNISDIDFDRDKCTELIKLNTTTYYNVFTMLGGAVVSVGTMMCFSDDMTHVLTQVLFSHYIDPNSRSSHKDAEIYVHYRSFNYKRSTLDIPAYTWTEWKLLTSSEFNAKFIGEASDSSADTDPFIVLGRFSKESTETTQAFYDRVNAKIDSTFSQDAGSENKKYCGDMRVFTGGVRTNIHQYVINYDAGKYVQVADGPIDVDANGKLLFSRNEYKVFSRLIEGGVAGSWTEFGRSPSILDIGTFANKDAACAYAARAEIAGNKDAALLIFRATGATGAVLQGRIFQQVNGLGECMQILMWDKKLYRRNVTGASGVEGSGTNAFAWEETGAQKLQYDSAARKLTMKSYENGVIAETTLPEVTSGNAGLMTGQHLTRLYNTLTASVGAFDADISATTKDNPVTAKMVGTTVKGGDIVFAWHKLEGFPLTSVGFLYRVGLQYYNISPDAAKPIPDKNGLLTNRDKTAVYICVNDELVKVIGE